MVPHATSVQALGHRVGPSTAPFGRRGLRLSRVGPSDAPLRFASPPGPLRTARPYPGPPTAPPYVVRGGRSYSMKCPTNRSSGGLVPPVSPPMVASLPFVLIMFSFNQGTKTEPP